MGGQSLSKSLLDIPLTELVPDSILSDPKVVAAARAIQGELDLLLETPAEIEFFGDLDDLPMPVMQMLAWEMGLSAIEWQLALTDDDKRQLVRDAYEINRLRGTRRSLERVFEILNMTATIEEWWEYGGDPYTFRISVLEIGGRGILPEEYALIDQLIYAYKPLRSWMDSILFMVTSRGELCVTTKLLSADTITVYPKRDSVNVAVLPYTRIFQPGWVSGEPAVFGMLFEDGSGVLFEGGEGAVADL